MTIQQDRTRAAADERHWRLTRRSAGWLMLAWFGVTFVPPFLPRELRFDGAPVAVWIASQLAPLAYLLIVWRHERRMHRLDREHRAAHGD